MGKRRKRLLTVEIIVWDEGATVKYRPGVPDNTLYDLVDAKGAAYITALRKCLEKGDPNG